MLRFGVRIASYPLQASAQYDSSDKSSSYLSSVGYSQCLLSYFGGRLDERKRSKANANNANQAAVSCKEDEVSPALSELAHDVVQEVEAVAVIVGVECARRDGGLLLQRLKGKSGADARLGSCRRVTPVHLRRNKTRARQVSRVPQCTVALWRLFVPHLCGRQFFDEARPCGISDFLASGERGGRLV